MMAHLRYVIGAENSYNYRLQGLHPVHLGDSFANGRYEVVHKLGHGRSSTCWLVYDTKTRTYASLKIIVASKSVTEVRPMWGFATSHYSRERSATMHQDLSREMRHDVSH